MKMKHAPTFEGAWMRGAVGIGAWLALPAACAVGPDYQRPPAPVPAAYAPAPAGWKPARPSDELPRGAWWQMFGDPTLDGLEAQIAVANQTLKAAEAQFAQARAQVDVRRAGLLPTIGAGLAGTWNRQSQNKALFVPAAKVSYTDVALPIDVSYELDVWGRVRRTIEAARADAQASAADLEAVRLSLHAELAIDYFDLRTFDAELRLLQSTVGSYTQALALAESRHAGGIASGVDVAQARAQLDVTRAQAIDVEVARSQREHAIAVIVGRPPSSLRLPPADDLPARVPVAPVGLPSELLERRPDIAAAERRMAAANAQIGVARAAYFPTVSLIAQGGFESSTATNLLALPSALFAIGASAMATLFDGGRRRALNEQAQAAYDQTVASYRATVLAAFRDVEDDLAALRILDEESRAQAAAVASAEQSLTLSVNRYKGGVVAYLEVLTAQNVALSAKQTAIDIFRRRLSASVLLVKALGGGWAGLEKPAGSPPPRSGS
jgi:NodT family efflux transporter outer membrane factor (OMF) lipoprotein